MKRDELKVGQYYAERRGSSSWALLRFVGIEPRSSVKQLRYERKLPDYLVFEVVDDEQRPQDGMNPRRYESARDLVTWDEYQAWKTAYQGKEDARARNKARLIAACDALGLTSSETAWHGFGQRPAVLPDVYLVVREEPERCFAQVGIDALERVAPGRASPLDGGNQIVDALAHVHHTGDYGIAWWRPATGDVHLVMGDADGDADEGLTPFAEIEKLLRELPFVRNVVIADEHGPDQDEGGWVELGKFGQEIKPSWLAERFSELTAGEPRGPEPGP